MRLGDRIKNFFRGPSLEELIIDLKMYTNEIARTRDRYKQRAKNLYEQAKQCIINGDDARAKMYAKQYLNLDRTAYSLDMFVISMQNLIFDLDNARSTEQIALVLGKISKCLDKLNILKTRGVSKILGRVTRQMGKIGISMQQITNQLTDYEPFNIEPVTSTDLDKVMDKMVSEVIAEGSAMGLPETKIAELERKRQAFKSFGKEESK